MASHIGCNDLREVPVPDGGYAHETSAKKSRPVVPTKNDQGVTVFIDQMPHEEHAITVKGTGIADFTIAIAASNAADTVQVTEVSYSHELGKRPEFEISARKFVNDAAP